MMTNPRLAGFALALTACLAMPAQAEIYKWVDENGRVHFGSGKSATAGQQVEQIEIKSRFTIKSVSEQSPLMWQQEEAPRPLAFSQLSMQLARSENKQVRIGGIVCGGAYDLYWDDGHVDIANPAYAQAAARAASVQAYSGEDAMSGLGSPNALSVTGKLIGVELNVCPNIRRESKNSTWLKIEWEVSDPLNQQPSRTFITEGSHDASDGPYIKNGIEASFAAAIEMAARNLLAEQFLVEMLTPIAAADIPAVGEPLEVPLVFGSWSGSFTDSSRTLKDTAVIVKTENGHGSGVIVTEEGHVLTNAHVVGSAQTVEIKTNDRTFEASVFRVNPMRDVALIKIHNPLGLKVAPISESIPDVGSSLYVIGTPLNESFSQSITSGILSAERNIGGASYFQTDAAINRGNSGGPVFNDRGEVIGLTVAGYFTHDGASMNINYVIPIDDALDKLNIQEKSNPIVNIVKVAKQAEPSGVLDQVHAWLSTPAFTIRK